MRSRVGAFAGLSVVVVAALCCAASLAAADPSVDCRNLALLFGSRPAALDVQSLATLSTCVTEEIQAHDK